MHNHHLANHTFPSHCIERDLFSNRSYTNFPLGCLTHYIPSLSGIVVHSKALPCITVFLLYLGGKGQKTQGLKIMWPVCFVHDGQKQAQATQYCYDRRTFCVEKSNNAQVCFELLCVFFSQHTRQQQYQPKCICFPAHKPLIREYWCCTSWQNQNRVDIQIMLSSH